jgi:hypothetical protein
MAEATTVLVVGKVGQRLVMTWRNEMTENGPYFVGWGTLTLINSGLAQSKGRSGLLWWLASVFLGPLATFLIVILPPVRPITIFE